MRKMTHATRLLAACVLFAATTAAVKAAPLDNNVPGDAVLYVGWQGADALAPAYAQSNLHGFIAASGIPAFVANDVPQMLSKYSGDPAAAAQVRMALTLAAPFWKHPTALYIPPVDFTKNPQQPTFRAAILCDAGADAQALSDRITPLLASIPDGPQKPTIATDGKMVVIATGIKAQALLASLPGTAALAANPLYRKATAGQPASPALACYFDMRGAIANIEDGLKKDPTVPPMIRTRFRSIVDAIGVGGITQVAFADGFDQKQWIETSFIGTQGPRVGLMHLMDPGPVDPAAFKLIPKDAFDASVVHLDMHDVYGEVRTAVGKIDPDAQKTFDQQVAMVNQAAGFNIDTDLLQTLGETIVTYRAPISDAAIAPAAVLIKLRDPKTFSATLAKIEAKASAALKAMPPSIPVAMSLESRDVPGVGPVMIFHTAQASVAWTVHGDYLCVSTSEALKPIVDQVDHGTSSILDNADFARLYHALPAGVSSVAFRDPAKSYPEVYKVTQGLAMLARSTLQLNIPTDLLPAPDAVAPYLTPGITASWADAAGIHGISHAAFPGAGGADSQQALTVVAVGALGTAILLPSLGRARELANRSADAASARGLAQSCIVYAAEHDDKFPDSLAPLLTEGMVIPHQLVSKRSGTPPLPLAQFTADQNNPAQLEKDLAEHCDFVYLGKGLTSDTNAEIALIYQNPGPRIQDGINIAFEDGHTEFVKYSGLRDAFKATNDYRKTHGMPTVDVDALLKAAPK